KKIRTSLGISVPVPGDPSKVVEALMEGLLLRGGQEQLSFDFMTEERDRLHLEWDKVTEREHRLSQTMFAQHALRVEEVAAELASVQEAIGSRHDVERFVRDAVTLHGGRAPDGGLEVGDCPRALRDAIGTEQSCLAVRYELPVRAGELYLNRTHPVVEGLASWVLDSSLDPLGEARARRTGAIRTDSVLVRTTLLLVRLRFHVVTRWRGDTRPEQRMLAEELQLVAFEGRPGNARWLESAEMLLEAEPSGNLDPGQARELLFSIRGELGALQGYLEELSRRRAGELLKSHQRVRQAGGRTGLSHSVEPQLPVDLLGVYLFLPGGGGR
ncbi:ATP-dependent helicase, partial [bacterium CPR1]|nr:ATP-dependent helicase [bacterium CPR1]